MATDSEEKAMKKINWLRFMLLFIVLVVVIWIGKNKITEWKMENGKEIQAAKDENEKKEEIKRRIIKIASEYNAIINWDDSLDRRKYSFEVYKAMKPNDIRPILIIASLRDIIKRDDKYFILFNHRNMIICMFSLECSHSQVSQLLEQKPNRYGRYAVIAHIKSVQKQEYFTQDGELIEINERFFANGQCVGLVYLQDGF
jgi:hypothetical protein